MLPRPPGPGMYNVLLGLNGEKEVVETRPWKDFFFLINNEKTLAMQLVRPRGKEVFSKVN